MSNSYFAKKFSMLSINKDTGGKMHMTLNEKNAKMRRKLIKSKELYEYNKAIVYGTITKEFEPCYEVDGHKFYRSEISSKRKSTAKDIFPIIVSSTVIKHDTKSWQRKQVEVQGTLRAFCKVCNDGKSHLIFFLLAKKMEIYEPEENMESNDNLIYLEGYLCKAPVFRETPAGIRITELKIAVNRMNGNTDYIPCVAWNEDACWAQTLTMGDEVTIFGRIQSREYFKKDYPNSETGKNKTTYEISVLSIRRRKCSR